LEGSGDKSCKTCFQQSNVYLVVSAALSLHSVPRTIQPTGFDIRGIKTVDIDAPVVAPPTTVAPAAPAVAPAAAEPVAAAVAEARAGACKIMVPPVATTATPTPTIPTIFLLLVYVLNVQSNLKVKLKSLLNK
jgi:hypothetical protein